MGRRPLSFTLLAFNLLSGAALAQQKTEAKEYVIQKGDLITIEFFRDPHSFKFQTRIRQDGKITLPKYGDILAAAKTIPQLNTDIRALVSKDTKLPSDFSVVIMDRNGMIYRAVPGAIY